MFIALTFTLLFLSILTFTILLFTSEVSLTVVISMVVFKYPFSLKYFNTIELMLLFRFSFTILPF